MVPDLLGLPAGLAQSEELEFYGDVNLMKAALYFADAITTVSPTYAREIRTLWYGEGLDGVLNRFSYKLTGIVNGLDMEAVNPAVTYTWPIPSAIMMAKWPTNWPSSMSMPCRRERIS